MGLNQIQNVPCSAFLNWLQTRESNALLLLLITVCNVVHIISYEMSQYIGVPMSIFWPKIIFSKLPKNMLFLGMENCILSLSGVRKVFWCFVKGTCLRLSWFPFFFHFFTITFPFGHLVVRQGIFFRVRRAFWVFPVHSNFVFRSPEKLKRLCSPEKNSLSHHQMSFWKSSRQKKMETSFAEGSSFLMHQKNFTYPRKIQEQTI